MTDPCECAGACRHARRATMGPLDAMSAPLHAARRPALVAVVAVMLAAMLAACDDSGPNDTASDANLDLRAQDGELDLSRPEDVRRLDASDSDARGDEGDDTRPPDTTVTADTDAADVDEPCGPGSVRGRVCAPNGDAWVGGALVSLTGLDCQGEPFTLETVAGGDGAFALDDVPAGVHELRVVKGSFEASYMLRVRAGAVTDLTAGTEKTCLIDESVRIAVVDGYYDSIHQIVDRLGLEFDFYSVNASAGADSPAETLLADAAALSTYDIVMVNCGLQHDAFTDDEPDEAARELRRDTMRQAIASFVAEGGSVYASDRAWWLLEGIGLQAHHTDGTWRGSWRGRDGDVDAQVVDPVLADVLGTTSMTVHFPLQGWVLALEPPDGATSDVLVRGDAVLLDDTTVTGAPLLLTTRPTPTAGRVIFTSFHHEDQLADDVEQILQQIVFSL